MHVRKLTAALAAVPLLLASGIGIAHADNIQDNIEGSGSLSLVAGASSGAIGQIRLHVPPGGGSDPDPGCNIDAGEAALVLDIVTPTGVTASPDPLAITQCDTWYPVEFKASSSAVSGTVTVTIVSQPAGGGTFNKDVAIPITVTQPTVTNTAPRVSVTGVADGESYPADAVPQPGCAVVDDQDTDEAATPVISNGAYNALGTHTVTCSYTDKGQPALTGTATATYTVLRASDTTPPVITKTVTGTMGLNDWYTSDVSIDWTVTENESPETLQLTGCDDVTVSADQQSTSYSCSAVSEGGSALQQTVSIKRDATAPVVSAGISSGTVGDNGWYKTDVTVRFTATDATSGLASTPTSPQSVTSVGEGSAVVVTSPIFEDNAGNTADPKLETLKIDKTAPINVAFVAGPAAGSKWFPNNVPAAPTCTADDATSGVASCVVTGYATTAGTHTMTATATDNAGHVTTAQRTYTVRNLTYSGFFAPVDKGIHNTIKGGNTVPLKFRVFDEGVEQTATSIVSGFSAKQSACGGTVLEDAIEEFTTNATGLRYDATAGHFIQNWKTPTKANVCYLVSVTLVDGTSITAEFKTK